MSSNGKYVAFAVIATREDITDAKYYVFLRDMLAGTTTCVSDGINGNDANDSSGEYHVVMSKDAHFIAYESRASNLVKGDTNESCDVFLYDVTIKKTQLISRDVNGQLLPAAPSAGLDGITMDDQAKKIVFTADSRLYLYERDSGKLSKYP